MDLMSPVRSPDPRTLLDRYERLSALALDLETRSPADARERLRAARRELKGEGSAGPTETIDGGAGHPPGDEASDDAREVEVFTAGFLADVEARLVGDGAPPPPDGPAAFLGHTPAIRRLRQRLPALADPAFPLLVLGERGTGKGMLARTVHHLRGGAPGSFFSVSCSAVPASLAESTLFGHEKGAFTGAHTRRQGLLATADGCGGTLYLDDLGQFAASVQPKLLEAREEGVCFPVGGDHPVAIGKGGGRRVKLVASSQPAALRRVRPDLLDRLSTLMAVLPPLRERRLDALLLADHEVAALSRQQGTAHRLSRAGREALLGYAWPGNVRQLRNVVARAFVMACDDARLGGGVVQGALEQEERLRTLVEGERATSAAGEWMSLEEMEHRHIRAALDRTGGNVTRAARLLGLRRTTLQSRLRSLDLRRGAQTRPWGAEIPAGGADVSAAPASGGG